MDFLSDRNIEMHRQYLNTLTLRYQLFEKSYLWDLPLRSVGIRAINLKDDCVAVQQDLFSDVESERRQEKIEDSIHSIRQRYGDDVIKRGRVVDKK